VAASPCGTWLDLRTGDADRDDPARGQSSGRSRTLRAEAITDAAGQAASRVITVAATVEG
jgi:hypothetical protein